MTRFKKVTGQGQHGRGRDQIQTQLPNKNLFAPPSLGGGGGSSWRQVVQSALGRDLSQRGIWKVNRASRSGTKQSAADAASAGTEQLFRRRGRERGPSREMWRKKRLARVRSGPTRVAMAAPPRAARGIPASGGLGRRASPASWSGHVQEGRGARGADRRPAGSGPAPRLPAPRPGHATPRGAAPGRGGAGQGSPATGTGAQVPAAPATPASRRARDSELRVPATPVTQWPRVRLVPDPRVRVWLAVGVHGLPLTSFSSSGHLLN
ncbi:circumsporozoite protein-like isoform X1 [Myotis myotis]|uniref:circumsporozoite protein-like isoform X1 n=1 Tax=Myotis myotis TaxID=51298 RepID=UPI001749113D|nr:circumsporozoite protein-like isoform X1 [Myotis myotis]